MENTSATAPVSTPAPGASPTPRPQMSSRDFRADVLTRERHRQLHLDCENAYLHRYSAIPEGRRRISHLVVEADDDHAEHVLFHASILVLGDDCAALETISHIQNHLSALAADILQKPTNKE